MADLADDAAGLMVALGVDRAHVVGFSGGGAIAQELALRHPSVVRSLVLIGTWARADAYFRRLVEQWRRLVDAPSERAMLEAFFLWVYSRQAHEDGTVATIIEETLAFPHGATAQGFLRQLDAFAGHDTLDRLESIRVPTMVVAGEQDLIAPPAMGRAIAESIAGAELVVVPGQGHQPFQERPTEFNDLIARFWASIDGS